MDKVELRLLKENERFERFANALQAWTLALQSLKLITEALPDSPKSPRFRKASPCRPDFL